MDVSGLNLQSTRLTGTQKSINDQGLVHMVSLYGPIIRGLFLFRNPFFAGSINDTGQETTDNNGDKCFHCGFLEGN